MLVQDYPITQAYGYDPTYPLHNGFHQGIDYGAPETTPIIVNGVTIGLVGHTGAVYDQNGQNTIYAAHLHVGKWDGNTVLDPGVKNGFTFQSAVVIAVAQDDVNGKYIKLQADGFQWIYDHMSDNSKVSVGQVLQGEPMSVYDSVPTPEDRQTHYQKRLFRDATPAEKSSTTTWGQILDDNVTELGKRLQAAEVHPPEGYVTTDITEAGQPLFKKG